MYSLKVTEDDKKNLKLCISDFLKAIQDPVAFINQTQLLLNVISRESKTDEMFVSITDEEYAILKEFSAYLFVAQSASDKAVASFRFYYQMNPEYREYIESTEFVKRNEMSQGTAGEVREEIKS